MTRLLFATLIALASCKGMYNLESKVTVSGLSSGAFAAVQFGIAFSSHVIGTGVFAGGPYYCAQDSITDALTGCMSAPSLLDVSALVSATQSAASSGEIDALSNVATSLWYLYSGTDDYTVNPGVVAALQQQLVALGVPSSNVVTEFTVASGHCIPTLNFGGTCSATASPFLNQCSFDGVGAMLTTFYPALAKRKSGINSPKLIKLPIANYTPSGYTPASASLGDDFYVYVPPQCASGATCSLHIAFHGCEQTINDIGTTFIEHAGYINWAATNNITLLFPQAVASAANTAGCFDWWGFTDANYAYQSGAQMATVANVAVALGAFY